MTSLFDLDQNSSDSEDDLDYVPEENQLSDNNITDGESEPNSGDDEKIFSKNRTSNTKKRSVKRKKHNVTAEVTECADANVNPVKDKVKADEVWKNFLDEVAEIPRKVIEPTPAGSMAVPLTEERDRDSLISSDKNNKTQISDSEIFQFAGETISVSKDGSVSDVQSPEQSTLISEEDSSLKKDMPKPALKRKGLQNVLGTIMNKKQKLTTLQKSLIDWKSYKKDEGIEEELERFNKGKGGFIERQRFLQRSDVRSYEIERDMRLSKVKKT